MKLQLFLNGLMRGTIPLVVMTTIAYFLSQQDKINDAKGTFYSGLIIFVVACTSVVYDIDQWSLTTKTLVHFLIMLLTVYPILLISGWFPLKSFKDALVILGCFLIVGVVLWSVFFFLAKKFNW